VSNDAGTAMGAAMLFYYSLTQTTEKKVDQPTLYLGPKRAYTDEQIKNICDRPGVELVDCDNATVVRLLTEKNIVSLFQGASENGPRALGNRSILFDPRFKDGKDFVNSVKRREYFRPFAGSILHEYVHEWFDLRGMEETPHMMYAVNCQPDIEEKIPSIIHVDGTCRIQSVKREQNPLYYDLIKEFHSQTECPIIFNTSFNLGGEPLVETLEDAVRTLQLSEIEYLFLPEYGKLVKVKND
jgi:carbamoyltransferase